MMAYERPKSAWNNFSKFIKQLQAKTKTLVRKLERILIKLNRQNVPLSFNQTCLNEGLLPNYTHTQTHTHTYIYMCWSLVVMNLKNKMPLTSLFFSVGDFLQNPFRI